jgi:hypothetical protein
MTRTTHIEYVVYVVHVCEIALFVMGYEASHHCIYEHDKQYLQN